MRFPGGVSNPFRAKPKTSAICYPVIRVHSISDVLWVQTKNAFNKPQYCFIISPSLMRKHQWNLHIVQLWLVTRWAPSHCMKQCNDYQEQNVKFELKCNKIMGEEIHRYWNEWGFAIDSVARRNWWRRDMETFSTSLDLCESETPLIFYSAASPKSIEQIVELIGDSRRHNILVVSS